MGFALRAAVSPRRWAAILLFVTVVLGATISRADELTAASATTDISSAPATIAGSTGHPPRVLLIGDSILDQQGSAAAFQLRQAGVDATAVGLWGSGLLTRDQYDFGRTKLSGTWLRKARHQISTIRPDVVGVYLNHNYWPPFPHDANGREISDLWSPEGQRMIAQQVRTFITILRADDARVFFISPIPTGTSSDPDPNAWSAIWHAYLPVLREMNVPVAETAGPVEGETGLRTETRPSCAGAAESVRPPGDIHLTRFGAGLAGSALASFVAGLVDADLRGNAAPGAETAALVPTRDGSGYWLVGCDGSVYHFGSAANLAGARGEVAGHGGVVAAVPTASASGLWLVTADGEIATVGDAPSRSFSGRADSPIASAIATPDGNGLWATTQSGVVLSAGSMPALGNATLPNPGTTIVGIAATNRGLGYWLVADDGQVFAFGDARVHGTPSLASGQSIVGIAAAPTDGGYWLVGNDGRVHPFGDAQFYGNGTWQPKPYPYNVVIAAPGPTVGIVSGPASAPGYWTFAATGRVVPRGAVLGFGGDNNLALFTQ